MMAVIDVAELPYDRTGSDNDQFQIAFTRSFKVVSNNRPDGPNTIISGFASATGIVIGSQYVTSTESNTIALCKNRTATYIDDVVVSGLQGGLWHVNVEYGQWENTTQNPLDKPIEVDWDIEEFERPTDIDINGKPITNAAFDVFLEPIMVDDSRPLLTIVRNEATYSPLLAWQLRKAINQNIFFTIPAKCCQVRSITSRRSEFDEFLQDYYWIVTYVFATNGNGWQRKILNAGLRELQGMKPNWKRVPILEGGVAVTDPVMLDAQGARLAPGKQGIYLPFDLYPTVDFGSAFNFPGS